MGILQARILEWVAMLFSRVSFQPRDQIHISMSPPLAGGSFTTSATWKAHDKPRQCIKKQRHYLADKCLSSQSYGFSNSDVYMWDLDHNEGWVPMNWCFQTAVLEKTLESPLDSKEIKPVNPKGNQPWIFTGRTDAEAEAAILWSPDAKSWFIGKTLMLGKTGDERRRGQ